MTYGDITDPTSSSYYASVALSKCIQLICEITLLILASYKTQNFFRLRRNSDSDANSFVFFFILSYLYFSKKKCTMIYIYLTFRMKSLGSSSGFRLSSSHGLSPERDSHLHMDFLVLCQITLPVLLV